MILKYYKKNVIKSLITKRLQTLKKQITTSFIEQIIENQLFITFLQSYNFKSDFQRLYIQFVLFYTNCIYVELIVVYLRCRFLKHSELLT